LASNRYPASQSLLLWCVSEKREQMVQKFISGQCKTTWTLKSSSSVFIPQRVSETVLHDTHLCPPRNVTRSQGHGTPPQRSPKEVRFPQRKLDTPSQHQRSIDSLAGEKTKKIRRKKNLAITGVCCARRVLLRRLRSRERCPATSESECATVVRKHRGFAPALVLTPVFLGPTSSFLALSHCLPALRSSCFS